ncbi:DUF2585 domain-containing protein [Sphingomonadaceae bacterium]|nr:DUF2585 domain-containing protein [Sphingomonadaceae bacterium]
MTWSHFIHGMIMYGLAWLLWLRLPAKLSVFAPLEKVAPWALPVAVLLEAAWEISENTQTVIGRYREVTISWGYSGDSIVNSASDIGWMVIGFFIAARLPWKVSAAIAVFLELLALWVIRDNLTLNVIMLLWPIEAIAKWQAMG